MTILEMQIAFELEVGVIDSSIKPLSSDIMYWLNKGIEKFVKTRYKDFEQTQKRIDDIRTLVTEIAISPTNGTIKPNSFIATLPVDYMFTLGEEAAIIYHDIHDSSHTITKRVGVTETTVDRYRDDIDNPFSEHILHHEWARPLRLFRGNIVEIISDDDYIVVAYYLRYLKKPSIVDLPSTNCDLPDHTHSEIVKLSVGMYLENTKNNRYQSYSNEINTME
jgi:hypothetical protein